MKKILLAVIIVVLVPLYLGDVYLHSWTSSRLKQTLRVAVPGAGVDANVSGYFLTVGHHHILPKPMLPAVLIQHKLPSVNVHLQGHMNIGSLPIDDWYFSADSFSFDSTQLFDHKKVVVTEVKNAQLRITISGADLSQLSPSVPVTIDETGKATALVNGVQKVLTVDVDNDDLVFKTDGTELARIKTDSSRLFACQPKAAFEAHSLRVSCSPTRVPSVLSMANSN